jgi:hypothetical protein
MTKKEKLKKKSPKTEKDYSGNLDAKEFDSVLKRLLNSHPQKKTKKVKARNES